MILENGATLGAYTILQPLGSGGMGEVYRARDDRLKRDVAVKVLPERLANDEHARKMFEREAQSVAALSHPNILAIHDFGSDDNLCFAVMELLDGETLRDRMNDVSLSPQKAVEIALQITAGLRAAHARGIVHRDLKPANVFMTSDGLVKILDFGLALQQRSEPHSEDSETEALSFVDRNQGQVVGTLGYMSPEQIRAQPVDRRTDIFSLGVILYEMLWGERPFEGASSADVIGAILHADPQPRSKPDTVISPALERIVTRCLEKNADERFQTAQDLHFALDTVDVLDSGGFKAHSIPGEPETDDSASSVAVLRFTNMSSDPEQQYFCEGMAEEIINALARIDGLRVAARSSAFQFDPDENDARAVGEKLGVKTVLEGSVRTAGNRVRVSVQLVDVDNGFQLWADRFDREMDDIFALQDEISARVVEALKITLGGAAIEEPGRPTQSMDAYHLYLKGQHNWHKRERGALEKAASFFEQAAKKDPSYALAHCGVVNTYSSLALYGLDPEVARVTADAALARASESAPGDAETRAALGLKAAYLDWDWLVAEREFTAAIESDPSYVLAHCWLSIMLSWIGRGEEAVAAAERARTIDPLSPYTNTCRGLAMLSSGRPDEAHRALLESLDIDSDHLYSLWMMTSTLGALGRTSEAVAVADKSARLSGHNGFYLGWLAWACGIAGQQGRARSIIDELRSKPEGSYIQPLGMIQAYCGLGDVDSAFEWLERGLAVRDPLIANVDQPYTSPLRDDPRWPSVLERIGYQDGRRPG